MQTQQENSAQEPPVERRRVTVEEFAKAVSSLEARKQAELARLAGTVAIGDAVRDLEIDATPEEILAEVEAQHAQETSSTYWQKRRSMAWPIGLAAAGLFLIIGLIFAAQRQSQSIIASSPASMPQMSLPPFQQPWAHPQSFMPPLDYQSQTRQPGYGPAFTSLQLIPTGHPFWCEPVTAEAILQKKVQPRIFVDGEARQGLWQFIKYGNNTYVRGWVASDFQPQKLNLILSSQTSTNTLPFAPARSPYPELGSHPKQITLNINTLKVDGFYLVAPYTNSAMPYNSTFYCAYSVISASHITLDQHAWEKW